MSLLEDRLNAANQIKQQSPIKQTYEYQPQIKRMNLQNQIQSTISDNQESSANEFIFEVPERNRFPFMRTGISITEVIDGSDDNMSEEMLEAYEMKRQHEETQKLNRYDTFSRLTNGILVFVCIYIIFLIYGVVVTDYSYNDKGQIKPQILSVSDIREKKEFEIILGQYENCRALYEATLMLDYRLGEGVEDPITLAPQYEALLDTVENLSIKTDAMDVDTQYSQLKDALLLWIQNDIAIYLQKMSSAITQNNEEDASIAIAYKSQVYNNFSQITSNIVVLGESINGTDVTEVKRWSPETYVNNTVNSIE